jgi:hypothetical protein
MRRPRSTLMLDGTPILLCSCSDIGGESEYAVCVTAIDAVQFLQGGQIAQFVPIDANMLAPARTLDPPQSEADRLIEADACVQKNERDDHRVDEGRGGQMAQRTRLRARRHGNMHKVTHRT